MLNALVVILTCLFVYLKLTGAIYWSWLMVFSPIIAFVLYSIFVLVLWFILYRQAMRFKW